MSKVTIYLKVNDKSENDFVGKSVTFILLFNFVSEKKLSRV